MKARKPYRRVPVILALCIMALMGLQSHVAAQSSDTEELVGELATAITYYTEAEFQKGLDVAQQLLDRPNLTSKDSVAIYEVMAIINYSKGQQHRDQAFQYLDKMAKIGPCVIHLPHEIWPPELRQRWFALADKANSLNCKTSDMSDVTTVAIMEFDNHSVGEYMEQLGSLAKGIADMFEHDFGKVSNLTVIERDKIDYVLKEHDLIKEGAVSKASAVKAGELLGANYMIFGSIIQLDRHNFKMLARAVNVETSEIVASVEKEGAPDYFGMEKELTIELAKKLDMQVGDNVEEMIKQGGTDSQDAMLQYSQGLDHLDHLNYQMAYDAFKKAYDLDNSFAEAKRKLELLKPLVA